ncbi:PWWP domain-containing protein 1-like isoform X2 [Salvia miltiorrhiza]|uniref:PWWP domain-containing protein 1-like isoform X2 n=1 Tax=Salvia miltiorrhiza TaxID=226208 RepID=UPI0025AD9CD0|nr:PWWP domain-containing protein 1-like isoform X2 [Salvia miltiorrhiza]
MSASSNGGPGSPSSRENDTVREEDQTAPSTSGGDSAERSGSNTAGSIAESAGVSPADEDKPVEERFSDDFNEYTALKPEDADIGISDASGGGDARNQPSSSVSKKTKKRKAKGSVHDYDSMLSEFDQFASKGANEAVGYGYEIGDMVWGKVKSHPWWPGHIYNEALASPSVHRSKREGHVLVAFFGDSSYGWYDPAELIPFEENFLEKSQQTSSRPFLKAVTEAVDELSRRRALGLACRCGNEFNFWPSSVEDYFVVDVGDYEPVVYSLRQINKARNSFHPNEMLSLVKQLALTPLAPRDQTIEFIKNKATALACRRALFEEFDETYAQAFGTTPVRPSRPTAPMAVNPSRAPLSGRLVTSDSLGKKKNPIKPTKTKDQVEKDKYIFKRRDEAIHVRTKKTSSGQVGPAYPVLLDGSGLSETRVSDIKEGTDQASMVGDVKPLDGSKKVLEGKSKKPKLLKRHAGELSNENATLVIKKKKRKKEIMTEQPSGELSSENVTVNKKKKKIKKEIINQATLDAAKLPPANINSGEAVEKVSGVPLDIPLSATDNQLDNQKNDGFVALASSSEAKMSIDLGEKELPAVLEDLRALAINPFHGVERSCQATVFPLFLKYRSAVYQKSLVLLPPDETEKGATNSSKAPSTALHVPPEKTRDKPTMKLKRTLIRPDDPTKGGRKHGPPIRPDAVKKKRKLGDPEDTNTRKKLIDSEDITDIKKKKKKKIIDDPKLVSVDKKTLQRSNEPQRGEDVKEMRAKNALPASSKAPKLESSQRMQKPVRSADPTMLVMKFPAGAALPSSAHLRAKFARFGPLDHSATRVFWETYTCRLVYQHKVDAEAALEHALGSDNLFGSRNVRAYIREVRDKAVEAEPVKLQKEGISKPREAPPAAAAAAAEQRTASRIPVQSQQLKSCLKKPCSEDVGNGNGRGTRVKFILGGEGGSKTEQVSSSYPEGAPSSSYTTTHSTDVTSKNLPKFGPECIVTPLPMPSPSPSPSHQLQKHPVDVGGVELLPKNDISQQLLNLLSRCRDVVNNLTGALGYVPYHSL